MLDATKLIMLAIVAKYAAAQVQETFVAEIFYNKDDLNSGLYEGTVLGRKLFTSSAIPHGQGTMYYFRTDKFQRVNYTGDWVRGTREGNGTTHFRDGSVYTGEYKDGVEEGEGAITYADGNVLDGEFANGKIHGNAVFRYPNGDQREGFFKENVLDGQVIYTKDNGMIIIELWKNGVKIPDHEEIVREGSTTSTQSTVAIADDNEVERTTAQFDLSVLRNAIRSGDRNLSFKSFESDGGQDSIERPRSPPSNTDARALRILTDQESRNNLLAIFRRVNG